MRPELVTLAIAGHDYVLRAYSTFYTLAFIVSPLVAAWVARRRGAPFGRALGLYAGALAAGIVGARVLDLFVAWRLYADDPSRMWGLSFTGFSLYGGLVMATAAAIALACILRLPLWRLADSAVAGLVAGLVLMRVGCFLNGCCFGEITDVPWGVVFAPGSPAWMHQLATGSGGVLGTLLGRVRPVHPTQLYEMAGTVLCGVVAWRLMRTQRVARAAAAGPSAPGMPIGSGRAVADGVPFLAFALGFTLVRLGNHFLRAWTNTITAPPWFYPVFYVGLAATIAAVLAWRMRAGVAETRAAEARTTDLGRHLEPTSPLPPPAADPPEPAPAPAPPEGSPM